MSVVQSEAHQRKIMKFNLGTSVLLSTLTFLLPASGNSITTTFADNNQFTGNMFDIAIGSSSVNVTGLDVNVDTGSMTIDVYITPGTYVGNTTNSAVWTLVSATAVTGLGAGVETPVAVTPFTLSGGATYGMYVTIDENVNQAPHMYYTNGNNTYSNADLTLTLGDGIGGLFGSLDVTASRTWNGVIDYNLVASAPEPGAWLFASAGLAALAVLRRRPRS
jgi:MYXO-CTERM domain-containing protein